MSQTTITLLFLAFAIVSFVLEKIPLGLTATICALGLTLTGVVGCIDNICTVREQQRHPLRWHVCSRTGTF